MKRGPPAIGTRTIVAARSRLATPRATSSSAARAAISAARQIADPEQQVVDGVSVLRVVARIEVLELVLVRLDHGGIEQLAQLGVAEQLAQLAVVDRERLRPPLRERRIAVVEEVGHVAEQQRGGEGRRRLRVDGDDVDRARADLVQRVHERRHVEDVAQAFPIRFEQRRERSEACRDRQQVGGALSLLP